MNQPSVPVAFSQSSVFDLFCKVHNNHKKAMNMTVTKNAYFWNWVRERSLAGPWPKVQAQPQLRLVAPEPFYSPEYTSTKDETEISNGGVCIVEIF
jgi:hypothetical protein